MDKFFALLVGMALVFSVSLAQAVDINGVEINKPMLARRECLKMSEPG